MAHRVAIARGDGIGREIADAAQLVVRATGVAIDWVEAPLGQEAVRQFGNPVPAPSLDRIRQIGCALKGPLLAEKRSGGIVISDRQGERRYPSP